MGKLMLSTALVLPLSVAGALAQEVQQAQEGETVVIESESAAESDVEAGAEAAGEAVGEAVGDAAQATGEAIEQGAEAAGEAVEGAAEGVEGEMQEADVEVVEPSEAEGEAAQVETETVPAEGAAVGEAIVREQAPNELRVDWITGATVMSPDGESIGDVNDLILDGETGQLSAAVIGVGGFLGIGQKQIAVNWDELQIDYDANEITSTITADEADAAPEYVFREQEQAPAPAGTTGMGTGTDAGMGTGAAGTVEGTAPAQPAAPEGEPAPTLD